MHNAKRFVKLWFPLILYAILIFWLSSLEQPLIIGPDIKHIDKLIHFVEYSVFGFLLIRAIRGSGPEISLKNALIITFIMGTFYGFTDELHQSVVPGRYATIADFIFDSLGTLVGALIFGVKHRQISRE